MKRTTAEYTSDQRTPTVLPEMEELLPPLSGEQFSSLEADILKNGCYAPIIVNEDMVVIDGHNRLRICQKHGLPYRMLVFSFENLLEAKQWALDTQKGRRNLTLWELGQIALKLKLEIEARRCPGTRTDLSVNSPRGSTLDTRKELARAAGIGEQSMGRIARLSEDAPQTLKDALAEHEVSVNQAWDIYRLLQKYPEADREIVAAEMVLGEQELARKNDEADRQRKIADTFCRAYEKSVLLTPTEENIRIWVDCCCMDRGDIEDTIQDSYELVETFKTIGDILKNKILPEKPERRNGLSKENIA